MSVKPIAIVPKLIDEMNKINMVARPSPTEEIVIQVLNESDFQMILQLTTVRLEFEGLTETQLHWQIQTNYVYQVEPNNIFQQWFSPRWSIEDPLFSFANYICQLEFGDAVENPPLKTLQPFVQVGNLAELETTSKVSVNYKSLLTGQKFTTVDELDYLSTVYPPTSDNKWNGWVCATYRGTSHYNDYLKNLKANGLVKYRAGFKFWKDTKAEYPITNGFSIPMEQDFEY
jgi:hypothetical protein